MTKVARGLRVRNEFEDLLGILKRDPGKIHLPERLSLQALAHFEEGERVSEELNQNHSRRAAIAHAIHMHSQVPSGLPIDAQNIINPPPGPGFFPKAQSPVFYPKAQSPPPPPQNAPAQNDAMEIDTPPIGPPQPPPPNVPPHEAMIQQANRFLAQEHDRTRNAMMHDFEAHAQRVQDEIETKRRQMQAHNANLPSQPQPIKEILRQHIPIHAPPPNPPDDSAAVQRLNVELSNAQRGPDSEPQFRRWTQLSPPLQPAPAPKPPPAPNPVTPPARQRYPKLNPAPEPSGRGTKRKMESGVENAYKKQRMNPPDDVEVTGDVGGSPPPPPDAGSAKAKAKSRNARPTAKSKAVPGHPWPPASSKATPKGPPPKAAPKSVNSKKGKKVSFHIADADK